MEVTPVEDRMARVGPDHCRRSSNPRDRRHRALSRRDQRRTESSIFEERRPRGDIEMLNRSGVEAVIRSIQ